MYFLPRSFGPENPLRNGAVDGEASVDGPHLVLVALGQALGQVHLHGRRTYFKSIYFNWISLDFKYVYFEATKIVFMTILMHSLTTHFVTRMAVKKPNSDAYAIKSQRALLQPFVALFDVLIVVLLRN